MSSSQITTTQLQFSDAEDNIATISHSSGSISLNGANVTNVGTPTVSHHATTKAYVDSVASGLQVKDAVLAATTGNGTLASSFANGQSIDGVTLATGNRILVKNQTAGAENGIYTVNASGAPTRATDFDDDAEVEAGAFVFVTAGTTLADTGWVLTTDGSITLGTTSLSFSQFSSSGAGSSDLAGLTDVLVEDNSMYIGHDPSTSTNNANYNVAVGSTALDAITTADNNVAIGYNSGTALTTGGNNVMIGYWAGRNQQGGTENTAVGYRALSADNSDQDKTGHYNTAIGSVSLWKLTSGHRNTAVGYESGKSTNTGTDNVFIGYDAAINLAGSSIRNVVIGSSSLPSNASASNAVLIGYGATHSADDSTNQIVIGTSATGVADNSVTLGNADVTAVYMGQDSGAEVLCAAVTASGAVSTTDATASTSATTGALTVAGGAGIAGDLSVGDDLRLVSDAAVLSFGADSDVTLTHVADSGLLLNAGMQLQFRDSAINISSDADGYMNVQADTGVNLNIGGTDELAITAGTATFGTNIVIPDGGNIGSVSDADALSISAGGVVNISSTTASSSATTGALKVAGGAGISGALHVTGSAHAASYQTPSDSRLKSDVVEIAGAVAKIQQIRGVDFVWKESGKSDTGVIAQEVEQVLPHVVSETEAGTKTVDYSRITALLIQAVKEQQDQIDELKAIIAKQ